MTPYKADHTTCAHNSPAISQLIQPLCPEHYGPPLLCSTFFSVHCTYHLLACYLNFLGLLLCLAPPDKILSSTKAGIFVCLVYSVPLVPKCLSCHMAFSPVSLSLFSFPYKDTSHIGLMIHPVPVQPHFNYLHLKRP